MKSLMSYKPLRYRTNIGAGLEPSKRPNHKPDHVRLPVEAAKDHLTVIKHSSVTDLQSGSFRHQLAEFLQRRLSCIERLFEIQRNWILGFELLCVPLQI